MCIILCLNIINKYNFSLGNDTEPEDLSIRTKVVDKINEIAELYGLGDESDTSQPIPDSK